MALPLTYNLRSLLVRKTTTLMTALGIALTVAVLLAIQGMLAGLEASFQATGHPLHLLVLRKGSNAELNSVVTREQFQVLRGKEGIRTENGEQMISHEVVTVAALPLRGQGESNVTVRGLSLMGVRMRAEAVKLAEGRWFQPGQRELAVGLGVTRANRDAGLGQYIQIGSTQWTVVGIFDGGQTAYQGEIWGDANQLGADADRAQALSSVLIRAPDRDAARRLAARIQTDQRLVHEAIPEADYYLKQAAEGRLLQALGTFVAVVMAIGSIFAAMNTMYAAVARRSREIGVLRVLGFSRASILFSFVLESVLLALAGGAMACLLILPFHGLSNRLGNMTTFSMSVFQFRVTPSMIAAGLGFAALMGVVGGLWPARMAARKDPLAALRDL